MTRITLLSLSATWVACSMMGHAQSQNAPASNPTALKLAAQSIVAMTGGTIFTDATLNGTATRTTGAEKDAGSALFKVRLGTGSRLDLNLTKGQRTEIHNRQTGSPKGSWSGPDQVSHRAPVHNSWVDAGWYFPPAPLASMISDPQVVTSYVGQESRNGTTVEHLRASRYLTGQSAPVIDLVQRLSTIDLYLDASSALPVAVAFNGHPDNDAGVDFPIEIRFSNYQTANGARLPMTIEKLVNGRTFLSLVFSEINLNSGLADSDFQVQ